jgi:hypothetical protein
MNKPTLGEAKSMYPHRYTMEHVPRWALKPCSNEKWYAPQYRNDKEWYDNTVFPPESGFRTSCVSSGQTWPLGHWLDTPYKKLGVQGHE